MTFSVFEDDDTLGLPEPIEDLVPVDLPYDPPPYVPPVVVSPTPTPTVTPTVIVPPELYDPPEPYMPPYVPPTPTVNPTPTPANTPPPAWAVGTFYGSAPGAASVILNILPSGAVSVNIGGSVSNGELRGTTLYMGSQTATVSQLANGIRTASGTQRIDYSSTPVGSGTTPVYTTPITVPPVVTVPIGTVPPVTTTPPVVPPTTPPVETEGTVNIAGMEIDNTTLLIGGGIVAAVFLLN